MHQKWFEQPFFQLVKKIFFYLAKQ